MLKMKFGVKGELEVVGLCATWRNCVQDVHDKKWWDEVITCAYPNPLSSAMRCKCGFGQLPTKVSFSTSAR